MLGLGFRVRGRVRVRVRGMVRVEVWVRVMLAQRRFQTTADP